MKLLVDRQPADGFVRGPLVRRSRGQLAFERSTCTIRHDVLLLQRAPGDGHYAKRAVGSCDASRQNSMLSPVIAKQPIRRTVGLFSARNRIAARGHRDPARVFRTPKGS